MWNILSFVFKLTLVSELSDIFQHGTPVLNTPNESAPYIIM